MIARVALATVVALATATCTGSEQRTVEVRIRFSRFVPDHFEFERGSTVEFVVTNTDPIDHEFIVGDEAVQQAHEKGTEAHHGARPGEISIPAGETRTTTYTFTETGRVLIGCHLPTHYDYGMKGDVVVTE